MKLKKVVLPGVYGNPSGQEAPTNVESHAEVYRLWRPRGETATCQRPAGRGTPPSSELLSPALFPEFSLNSPCVRLIRRAQFVLQSVRGGTLWRR